jgi:acetolactate synthase I/II/III large subunit
MVTTIDQLDNGSETTGARALVETLVRAGVEVVFGVAGHSNVALLDELSRAPIRYVGFRHEQLAVHAADGYFRVTHRPAVVLTTSGPGIANTISGLGDASLDCSAMVVISGEPQSYYVGRDAFQEVSRHSDAASWEIARPLVKRAWRVPHPDLLTFAMATAFRTATSGAPGPVLVSVPFDLFSHRQVYEIPNIEARRATGPGTRPSHGEVGVAVDLLSGAERPLLLAGGGAVLGDATADITELAELLDMPVITTMSGQGAISKYHPLYAGFISPFGTRPAHALLQAADTVLVVGSRLAEFDMSSWSREHTLRVPPSQLIQIDIDPNVIGRQYAVAVGLEAHSRLAVEDILVELRTRNPRRERAVSWYESGELAGIRADWEREIAEALVSDKKPIQPERLMGDLRKQLPDDGIVFGDAGIRGAIAQTLPVNGPRLLHLPSGWGTMGFAVGATIGAKVAEPSCGRRGRGRRLHVSDGRVGDGSRAQHPDCVGRPEQRRLQLDRRVPPQALRQRPVRHGLRHRRGVDPGARHRGNSCRRRCRGGSRHRASRTRRGARRGLRRRSALRRRGHLRARATRAGVRLLGPQSGARAPAGRRRRVIA